MAKDSHFIDEYQALRAEIIATYSRRATIQSVGTTLFAGLQSAALLGHSPELSFLGTFLILAFWRDDTRWTSAISRTGAYIRNVIEPRVSGLQWERILMVTEQSHIADPSPLSRLRFLLSRYPMTALAGLLLGLVVIMTGNLNSLPRLTLNIILLCVASLVFILNFIHATNYASIHRKWNLVFRDHAEEIEELTSTPNKRMNTDQ